MDKYFHSTLTGHVITYTYYHKGPKTNISATFDANLNYEKFVRKCDETDRPIKGNGFGNPTKNADAKF